MERLRVPLFFWTVTKNHEGSRSVVQNSLSLIEGPATRQKVDSPQRHMHGNLWIKTNTYLFYFLHCQILIVPRDENE